MKLKMKVAVVTVMIFLVLAPSTILWAGICEHALAMCLHRADMWYWHCMRSGEESACRYEYDQLVAACFNAYWQCLYNY